MSVEWRVGTQHPEDDMSCEHSREVHAWHDGQLDSEQRQAFEAHLAGCAACQRELDELQSLSRLLRSAKRVMASRDALRRMHESARRLGERDVLRIARRMTAAAALLLALGIAALVQRTSAQTSVSSTVPLERYMQDVETRASSGPTTDTEVAAWMEVASR